MMLPDEREEGLLVTPAQGSDDLTVLDKAFPRLAHCP